MSNPLPTPEVIRVECSACRGLGYTDATVNNECDECDRGRVVYSLDDFREAQARREDEKLALAERDARRQSLVADPFDFGGDLVWDEYVQTIDDSNECLRLGLTPEEVEAEERAHAARCAARNVVRPGSIDDDIPW